MAVPVGSLLSCGNVSSFSIREMNELPEYPARSGEKYAMLVSIYVEGGMAVFAIIVGYFLGIPPAGTLSLTLEGGAVGILATIPMLAFYVVLSRLRYLPFLQIRRIVHNFVFFFFRNCSKLQIALICALAGIGEELFFRGLLQVGLEKYIGGQTGLIIAILVSSLIFGLAHFITKTYAVLAFVIGVYLGLLFYFTGNIMVPIITHAVYDYCVIKFLLRTPRRKRVV